MLWKKDIQWRGGSVGVPLKTMYMARWEQGAGYVEMDRAEDEPLPMILEKDRRDQGGNNGVDVDSTIIQRWK